MEWISIKDKLPEQGKDCIVWATGLYIASIDHLGDWTLSDQNFTIIHPSMWQPLPEPPLNE